MGTPSLQLFDAPELSNPFGNGSNGNARGRPDSVLGMARAANCGAHGSPEKLSPPGGYKLGQKLSPLGPDPSKTFPVR